MPSTTTRNRAPRNGFTLIELIAALALGGLLLAGAGFGILATVRGYLMVEENAAMSQKAQLAMTRLINEYLACYDCHPEVDPDDLYTFNNILGERTLTLTGTDLTISGDDGEGGLDGPDNLIDGVSAFSAAYDPADDTTIIISLTLTHAQTSAPVVFTTRVLPRNTYK